MSQSTSQVYSQPSLSALKLFIFRERLQWDVQRSDMQTRRYWREHWQVTDDDGYIAALSERVGCRAELELNVNTVSCGPCIAEEMELTENIDFLVNTASCGGGGGWRVDGHNNKFQTCGQRDSWLLHIRWSIQAEEAVAGKVSLMRAPPKSPASRSLLAGVAAAGGGESHSHMVGPTHTHTTPPPPLCPRSPLSLQGFPNYLPSVLHTQNSTRCLLNSHSLHSQFSSFTSSVKKKFLISDRTHSPAPLQKA